MSRFEARQDARRKAYVVAAAIIFIAGVAVIASGFLARASKAVNENFYADPPRVLQRLSEIESRYQLSEGRYAASLDELAKKDLITGRLASGEVNGYRYVIVRADARTFAITAEPDAAKIASTTYYLVDETHTVRAQNGGPATDRSPAIWDPRDMQYR